MLIKTFVEDEEYHGTDFSGGQFKIGTYDVVKKYHF